MFVYSDSYYADLKGHVFPILKYRLLYDKMRTEGRVSESLFIEPRPACEDELQRVHEREYLQDFQACRRSERTACSELPLTPEIVKASVLNAGGSIVAAHEAVRQEGPRVGMNIGGGFHHAFPDHAEGFCYLNDVAIAIRSLTHQGLVQRVLVVDLDLHQGNGTAFIFKNEPEIFTFSMHQEYLYPKKEESDLDIGLDIGTGDIEYLELLERHLPRLLESHRPQLVVYLAGADPYRFDVLGALELTLEGLAQRDRVVYSECCDRGIPVVTYLAGGYASSIEDTVAIHYSTCLAMLSHARAKAQKGD